MHFSAASAGMESAQISRIWKWQLQHGFCDVSAACAVVSVSRSCVQYQCQQFGTVVSINHCLSNGAANGVELQQLNP